MIFATLKVNIIEYGLPINNPFVLENAGALRLSAWFVVFGALNDSAASFLAKDSPRVSHVHKVEHVVYFVRRRDQQMVTQNQKHYGTAS